MNLFCFFKEKPQQEKIWSNYVELQYNYSTYMVYYAEISGF